MARLDPQVNFRIPAALRDSLQQSSKATGRTLTAELVHRLESSFSPVEGNGEAERDAYWMANALFLSSFLLQQLTTDDEHAMLAGRNMRSAMKHMQKYRHAVEGHEKLGEIESMTEVLKKQLDANAHFRNERTHRHDESQKVQGVVVDVKDETAKPAPKKKRVTSDS